MKSRHPKLLWAAAVALLVIWVALFWVFIVIGNWGEYAVGLYDGALRFEVYTRPIEFRRQDLSAPDPPELFDEDVAGQEVRVGWIRGNRPDYNPYQWTEGLGGWPSIHYIDGAEFGAGWQLDIPLWLPLALVALLIWRWYGRHRPQPGKCRKCEYNLTGNVSGRCPECGQEVDASNATVKVP